MSKILKEYTALLEEEALLHKQLRLGTGDTWKTEQRLKEIGPKLTYAKAKSQEYQSLRVFGYLVKQDFFGTLFSWMFLLGAGSGVITAVYALTRAIYISYPTQTTYIGGFFVILVAISFVVTLVQNSMAAWNKLDPPQKQDIKDYFRRTK